MYEVYIRVAVKWLFLVLHPNKSRHRGNGIACAQATPRAALGFCSADRAENLCYQFTHGQKLLPQFRKIVGLVFRLGGTPTNASLAEKQTARAKEDENE